MASSFWRRCLVASELSVTLDRSGPLLKIHSLEHGVFSVFFLYVEYRVLASPLPLEARFFALPFDRFVVQKGDDVGLLDEVAAADLIFMFYAVRDDIEAADQQPWINDPLVKFRDRFQDQLCRGGLPAQVDRAVCRFRDFAAVPVGRYLSFEIL